MIITSHTELLNGNNFLDSYLLDSKCGSTEDRAYWVKKRKTKPLKKRESHRNYKRKIRKEICLHCRLPKKITKDVIHITLRLFAEVNALKKLDSFVGLVTDNN